MPFKIYNIHPADTLIPKIRPILRSPRLKKLAVNKSKIRSVALDLAHREKKKQKNFQLELKKALDQRRHSWLA